MLINPEASEAGFATLVGALTAGFEREVVVIDGKTIQRSFGHGRAKPPLRVVSAWASEQGLCWASAAWMARQTRSAGPNRFGTSSMLGSYILAREAHVDYADA